MKDQSKERGGVIDVDVIESEDEQTEPGTALARIEPGELSVDLVSDFEQAKEYASNARSESTKRAYAADWSHFVDYCQARKVGPLPALPETVASYLAHYSESLSVATLQRRMSAISVIHKEEGHNTPTGHPGVITVWKGLKRKIGTAPNSKRAAIAPVVRSLVNQLTDDIRGVRDRAVILVGFFGAFRRSELVGLNVEDIERTERGLTVTLRRSKTDQEGKGRLVALPFKDDSGTCPVRALDQWITSADITAGPLFRSIRKNGVVNNSRLTGRDVARIVKRAATAAGFDPSEFAGHSLRSGFATTAAHSGASDRAIMKQTGHKSRAMVDRYVQSASVWEENAAAVIRV